MARRELIYDIERYCPFNEQEEKPCSSEDLAEAYLSELDSLNA